MIERECKAVSSTCDNCLEPGIMAEMQLSSDDGGVFISHTCLKCLSGAKESIEQLLLRLSSVRASDPS